MAESIYFKIGKLVGRDARLVRTVAHHPFSFFSKVIEDMEDHRPVRFRYLGAFTVKPYWRKGLLKSSKFGYPCDGDKIYARVPEQKYNKTYINLKQGTIVNGQFESFDGSVKCPVSQVQFWVKLSSSDELS